MKRSLFNSLIYISAKHCLLYNALSDTFLILSQRLKEQWEQKSIEELSQNTGFYDLLLKGQYIIHDRIDEFKELQKQVNEVIYNEKDFQLIINPTLNCNFRCWYCYETHSSSKMDEKTLDKVKKFINRTVLQSSLSHFHLSFFGGEPLLYFKDVVAPLMEYTYKECRSKQKDFSMSFTSNGYLVNENFLSTIQQYEYCRISIQITLDGCREDHDKVRYVSKNKGSYDTIIGNIEKLLENGIYVILRINFTTQNISRIKDIVKDLQKPVFINNKYLTINFQQVWQDIHSQANITEMVDETIALFRENKLKVLFHYSDFVRNPCYADKKNEVIVNYNGNVYKCTATDFDKAERYGFLDEEGNIVWEHDKDRIRLEAILSNPMCRKCRIAPLCGGGCAERALENAHKAYCLLRNDERLKDKYVLDKFENSFL